MQNLFISLEHCSGCALCYFNCWAHFQGSYESSKSYFGTRKLETRAAEVKRN